MKIYTINSEYNFGSNMYILQNDDKYIVIDPSASYKRACETVNLDSLNCICIVLTHTHFDHMLTAEEWTRITHLPLSVSKKDLCGLSDPYLNCYKQFLNLDRGYFGDVNLLSDGDTIHFSNSKIDIIETPGHTAGSITLISEDNVFVGDVLFAFGGIGRYDLPGGDYGTLQKSISKILNLGDKLNVYSGHGPITTISKIKELTWKN